METEQVGGALASPERHLPEAQGMWAGPLPLPVLGPLLPHPRAPAPLSLPQPLQTPSIPPESSQVSYQPPPAEQACLQVMGGLAPLVTWAGESDQQGPSSCLRAPVPGERVAKPQD